MKQKRPIYPLAYAIKHPEADLDDCIKDMIALFQNGALLVACNRPLDRGKALINYLVPKAESLPKDGPAFRAAKSCLEGSTPNQVARAFETFFYFYFGEVPYIGANPRKMALDKAEARLKAKNKESNHE